MDDVAVILNIFKGWEPLRLVAPGDAIFSHGEPADRLFVIKSGNAQIQVNGKVVEVASAGDVLGEMGMIDGGVRSGDAIAASPCQVAEVNMEQFLDLLRDEPYFAIFIMRTLTRRLRQMDALAKASAPKPAVSTPVPGASGGGFGKTLPLDLMYVMDVWHDLPVQIREEVLQLIKKVKG
jgi:hypothetical protein